MGRVLSAMVPHSSLPLEEGVAPSGAGGGGPLSLLWVWGQGPVSLSVMVCQTLRLL